MSETKWHWRNERQTEAVEMLPLEAPQFSEINEIIEDCWRKFFQLMGDPVTSEERSRIGTAEMIVRLDPTLRPGKWYGSRGG